MMKSIYSILGIIIAIPPLALGDEVVIPCTAQADALHARCTARHGDSYICTIIRDWQLSGCCSIACDDYMAADCEDHDACLAVGNPPPVCEAEGAVVRFLCPRDLVACRMLCEG